jgi:hypothetical protein
MPHANSGRPQMVALRKECLKTGKSSCLAPELTNCVTELINSGFDLINLEIFAAI